MSIQQLIKEKDRKIQQLQQNINEVLNEYQKLDNKYFHCLQDGKDKQREIDRLNNIINTGGIPPIQEIENLRIQLQEWKNLALQLSTKIHNGHNYLGYN